MFVYTAKITRRNIAAALVVLGVVLCVVVAVTARGRGTSSHDIPAPYSTAAASVTRAETNAERIGFLRANGWEVSPEPVEFQEVLLPEVFSGVFLTYNEMQKRQGYDLLPLRGQRVQRFAYAILNHPSDSSGNARVNILIHNGQIIGGDVLTTHYGGELFGLKREAAACAGCHGCAECAVECCHDCCPDDECAVECVHSCEGCDGCAVES
jgi:hypothetical protein